MISPKSKSRSVGSLFSGIGGIDLGFEMAGFDVIFQVEKDRYCLRVLEKNFPDTKRFEDVKDVGKINLPTVNVLAGGFPCQPLSVAGKRNAQKDERWLWPEFSRIIGEIRPGYVFLENVPAITASTKHGRSAGVDVITDLTRMGYDSVWCIIPACWVGSPQLRYRWYCISRPHGRENWQTIFHETFANCETMAYPDRELRKEFGDNKQTEEKLPGRRGGGVAESGLVRNPDGFSARLDRLGYAHRWPAGPGEQYDWEPGRTVEKKSVKHCRARITSLGNAVVPQVIFLFAELIKRYMDNDQ